MTTWNVWFQALNIWMAMANTPIHFHFLSLISRVISTLQGGQENDLRCDGHILQRTLALAGTVWFIHFLC